MLGRRVVPIEDMVDKIKVATSSRDDSNFLIIARPMRAPRLGSTKLCAAPRPMPKPARTFCSSKVPESLEEMRTIGRTSTSR